MATRRSYRGRPSYIYLGRDENSISSIITSDTQFEFGESQLWSSNEVVTSEAKTCPLKKPATRKSSDTIDGQQESKKAASSVPVNIPDWSEILHHEYNIKNPRIEYEEEERDDGDGEESWIPPHEYLARTRMASFSVHEGIGRTLKGRDLWRVRNAIWKQTGFID